MSMSNEVKIVFIEKQNKIKDNNCKNKILQVTSSVSIAHIIHYIAKSIFLICLHTRELE